MKVVVGILLVAAVAAAAAVALWSRSRPRGEGGEIPAAAADESIRESPERALPPAPPVPPVAPPGPLPVLPRTAEGGPDALTPRKPTAAEALRVVQILVKQEKVGLARDLAAKYLREIPDGPEAQEIRKLTGPSH